MLVPISDINDDDHSYGRPYDEAADDGGMGLVISVFVCMFVLRVRARKLREKERLRRKTNNLI